MSASYPSSIKSWTPVADNTDDVLDHHINEAYDEIIALETYAAKKTEVDALRLEVAMELAAYAFQQEANVTAGLNGLSQMAVDVFNDANGIVAGSSSNYTHNNSTKAVDTAGGGRSLAECTVTRYGDAQITTTDPKIGTSCLKLDGTGDYLGFTNVTNFAWMHKANAKWTIRGWFKFNNFSAAQCIFDTSGSTSSAHGMTSLITTDRKIAVQIYFGSSGNYIVDSQGTAGDYPNDSNWHHIEISCDLTAANSNLKVFVDGVLKKVTNKTANTPSTTNNPYASLGTYGAGGGQFITGYVDEFEVANNVRNTTSASVGDTVFTPYTAALVPDYYTALLLHFTGADTTYVFSDDIATNVITTLVSNTLTATSAPSKMFVTTKQTISSGTLTYYVSRDGGTTWTEAALNTLIDVSGQPSGTSCKIKVVSSNEASASIQAWAFGYKI